VYSTFIGHVDTAPVSIGVDAAGHACVNGTADYITCVNAAGSALQFERSYPNGAVSGRIALDARGLIHAAGAPGLVSIVDRASPPSGIAAVANAAGTSATGRVVPGELISLYGWNLGDTVLVDELPAPVLYTSPEQVNAIVPFGVGQRERATITVLRNGAATGKAVVGLATAQPEIFKVSPGRAAALNEEGTVNSVDNPARPGSLMTVFGTGAPGWPTDTRDGSLNPLDRLTYLSVGASAAYRPFTEVTFSGAAPGLLAGVFQVNLRLAADTGWVPVLVMSEGEVSSPAFVYVAP
jgi:uncharacterized protein (TIGR03437 family)